MGSNSNLTFFRQAIDALDLFIFSKLNERWQLVKSIASQKGLKPQETAYRPFREYQILRQLPKNSSINYGDLVAIWKEIMCISAQSQNKFDIMVEEEFYRQASPTLFYQFGRHGHVACAESVHELLSKLDGHECGLAVVQRGVDAQLLENYPNLHILSLFPSVQTDHHGVRGFIVGWQNPESAPADYWRVFRYNGQILVENIDKIPENPSGLVEIAKVPPLIIINDGLYPH